MTAAGSKPEADIRSAALEVLKHRIGELPVSGWLRDNDSSRLALHELAKAAAAPAALSERAPSRTEIVDGGASGSPPEPALRDGATAEVRSALADLHRVCQLALAGKDGKQHAYFESRAGHFVRADAVMEAAEQALLPDLSARQCPNCGTECAKGECPAAPESRAIEAGSVGGDRCTVRPLIFGDEPNFRHPGPELPLETPRTARIANDIQFQHLAWDWAGYALGDSREAATAFDAMCDHIDKLLSGAAKVEQGAVPGIAGPRIGLPFEHHHISSCKPVTADEPAKIEPSQEPHP